MPQIINTNIASLNAQRNLDKSQNAQSVALQRLSSGLRINGAKDDAAGLAISNRLDAQVRGLNVANRNAGDGVSLAQTAEGALNSITNSLQRMRELALQASNGSNTSLERESLQEEVEQLKAEIASIADKTNFNGQKLLDGSFQNTSFQTGANVGEKIEVSIGRTAEDTLGAADTAGVSSSVSKTPLSVGTAGEILEITAGDLVINGVAVPSSASQTSADTSSSAKVGSSAISRAAAINAVSTQTGVVATADKNTVEGTSITADMTAVATGNVSINGVTIELNIAAATAGEGVRTELGKVTDAINAKSEATGVTAALVTTDDGFRIDLTAADGRNIELSDTGIGSEDVGLAVGAAAATAEVYVGNVTLTSTDGSDITLTSTTGNIDNAGFEEGVISGNTGGVVGDNTTAALVTGDVLINGVSVGQSFASDDTASTANSDSSAISIASAINRISDETGVSAKAGQNTAYSGDLADATAANLDINGVTIEIAVGTDIASKLTGAIDAINAKSGLTGVTAEALDADSYKLIAVDGRNIEITNTSGATDSGFADAVNRGGVILESAGEFTLGSLTGDIENSGLTVGTFGGSESGTLIKDIDVSTQAGAEAAIAGLDNAINQVASEQAKLGAIQNRFESTISNNAVNSENLSAAKSRISDADFAVETAALSRAQVLQQAGISVLSQANARPQQVLSLLQ